MILRQDVRFALRGFRRTPGFFATASIILMLGISQSVAMFTVFRTVLLHRLPVVDQDHVAVMWTYRDDPNIEVTVGPKPLAVFRREGKTIRDVAAVAHWPAIGAPLLDGERTVTLNRAMATGNFFDVLGVRPVLGRLFHSSDDDASEQFDITGRTASKALVLSYEAWQAHFGGDSAVIGRRLVERCSAGSIVSLASRRRASAFRRARSIGTRCGKAGAAAWRPLRSRGLPQALRSPRQPKCRRHREREVPNAHFRGARRHVHRRRPRRRAARSCHAHRRGWTAAPHRLSQRRQLAAAARVRSRPRDRTAAGARCELWRHRPPIDGQKLPRSRSPAACSGLRWPRGAASGARRCRARHLRVSTTCN
jgi:hypothetical protein